MDFFRNWDFFSCWHFRCSKIHPVKNKKEKSNISTSKILNEDTFEINIKSESEYSNQVENIADITVKEIIDEIHNLPPFQQKSAGKNYGGIKVRWEGRLWDVEKANQFKKNIFRVIIKPHQENVGYSILFYIDIEKYPELKVAKRKSTIKVSGKIKECSSDGMYVELKPEFLSVIENAENKKT